MRCSALPRSHPQSCLRRARLFDQPCLCGARPQLSTFVCVALDPSSPICAELGPILWLRGARPVDFVCAPLQHCLRGARPPFQLCLRTARSPLQLCLRGARSLSNFVCAGLGPLSNFVFAGLGVLSNLVCAGLGLPQLCLRGFPFNYLQSSPALPSHTFFFTLSLTLCWVAPSANFKKGGKPLHFVFGIGPLCRSLRTHSHSNLKLQDRLHHHSTILLWQKTKAS